MMRNDNHTARVATRAREALVVIVALPFLVWRSPQQADALGLPVEQLVAQAGPTATAPGTPTPAPESSGQPAKPRVAKPVRPRTPVAAVEARVSTLHQRLHITSAEEPQFKTYADVMRQNAQTIEALFAERAKSTDKSAVARLRWYAQLTAAHAEAVGKLVAPFEALYQSLSANQKKTADTLFEQIRQRPVPRRSP